MYIFPTFSKTIPFCTYHELFMIATKSVEADSSWKIDSEIMAETNCTGPCTYHRYETQYENAYSGSIPVNWIYPNDTVSAVHLFYTSAATYVKEEYWSYDELSMFGEVGGAIGVFLGWSFLNLYQLAVKILSRAVFKAEKH